MDIPVMISSQTKANTDVGVMKPECHAKAGQIVRSGRNAVLRATLIPGLLSLTGFCHLCAGQSPKTAASQAAASAIGNTVFDATTNLAWRHMKEPTRSFSIGPSAFNFRNVEPGQTALNVLVITNGTTLPVEITSLEVKGSAFKVHSPQTLPLRIPPCTEALMSIEFHPPSSRVYSGQLLLSHQASGEHKGNQVRISLKGRGLNK